MRYSEGLCQLLIKIQQILVQIVLINYVNLLMHFQIATFTNDNLTYELLVLKVHMNFFISYGRRALKVFFRCGVPVMPTLLLYHISTKLW